MDRAWCTPRGVPAKALRTLFRKDPGLPRLSLSSADTDIALSGSGKGITGSWGRDALEKLHIPSGPFNKTFLLLSSTASTTERPAVLEQINASHGCTGSLTRSCR